MEMAEGHMHRRSFLLGWGLGIAGAALLSFSAFTIYSFFSAVAHRAPIIEWDEGGWIGLPLALAFLMLFAGIYVGRHDGPSVDGWRKDAVRRLLMFAACLLPFVIVLPLSAHWVAGAYLEARGYTACGKSFWIVPDSLPNTEAALAQCHLRSLT